MISEFVTSYGYLAILVGTMLEGETILIAAGFAVHRGLLDGRLVVLVATIGATLGDEFFFLLGRWKGDVLIERFPSLARHKPRIHGLLERYDAFLILIVRFLYGLRIAGPLILGTSRVPLLRFAFFNLSGAVLWATLVFGAGYAFGLAISSLVADLKRIEEIVLVSILAVGAVLWLFRRYRKRGRA